MKPALSISLLFLFHINCFSQVAITDSIHPLFNRNELDGDKIRSQFDNFEPAFPTKKVREKYNQVILSLFHSRNLYINTGLNLAEKPKELAPFQLELKKGMGYAVLGNVPNTSSAVPLFDSLPVVVTAYGINNENRNHFRFRVIKNRNEEIVPWQEPHLFSPVMMYFRYNADGTEQQQMAYLGSFMVPVGNSLTVEVKSLQIPDTVYKISAVWMKRAPSVLGTYSADKLKNLLDIYKFQWKHDLNKFNTATYYGDIVLKPVDSLLRIDSVFEHDQNNLFIYLKDKVRAAELIEYNLVKGKDSTGWKGNSFDPNVVWLQDLSPGEYRLLMRYAFQRQTISSFSFTVKPAWYQTIWFKILAGVFVLFSLLSVYLFITNRKQKIRLKHQQIENELSRAEIKSIKSQFNPHFVFNALASIQGLITKNNIEAAHLYLNDFSTLLRNSLKESEKEYISLSKDVAMIDNYIKLEQLRFNFQYQIILDENINADAIDVPVLLLQPVVENAIKHGISGLYDKGRLTIAYLKMNADLIITIRDNGNRYKPGTVTGNGRGLKLTEERVKLINKTLKGQYINWEIKSKDGNTEAVFFLKNWLL